MYTKPPTHPQIGLLHMHTNITLTVACIKDAILGPSPCKHCALHEALRLSAVLPAHDARNHLRELRLRRKDCAHVDTQGGG